MQTVSEVFYDKHFFPYYRFKVILFNLSAFSTTDRLENDMAALANMGLKVMLNQGYNIPIAKGINKIL